MVNIKPGCEICCNIGLKAMDPAMTREQIMRALCEIINSGIPVIPFLTELTPLPPVTIAFGTITDVAQNSGFISSGALIGAARIINTTDQDIIIGVRAAQDFMTVASNTEEDLPAFLRLPSTFGGIWYRSVSATLPTIGALQIIGASV